MCEAEGGNEDGGWRKERQVRLDLSLMVFCVTLRARYSAERERERGMVGERALAAAKTATCVLPSVCTVS